MSQQRIVDSARAKELRKLKTEDPEAYEAAIRAEADALLNTAIAYEECVMRGKAVVNKMRRANGVTEKATQFDGFVDDIDDALALRLH